MLKNQHCWIRRLTEGLNAVFLAEMNLRNVLKGGLVATLLLLVNSCGVPEGAYAPGRGADALAVNTVAGEARERPGLGTGWGEEMKSRVRVGKFERSGGKPKAVEVIYYNDAEGVKAMTGGGGWKRPGMLVAAGGMIEWGVKTGWGYAKTVEYGGKRFVVGKNNAEYSIVVRNVCHSRLELVVSVDGLDVIDGRKGSVRKRGYVIEPGQTLIVKGFRTSADAVNAFKFSSVGRSYSNQRYGSTRNVGVLGLAVFTEEGVDPWRWSMRELKSREDARVFAEAPLLRAR